jgi:hypothetical protein
MYETNIYFMSYSSFRMLRNSLKSDCEIHVELAENFWADYHYQFLFQCRWRAKHEDIQLKF